MSNHETHENKDLFLMNERLINLVPNKRTIMLRNPTKKANNKRSSQK